MDHYTGLYALLAHLPIWATAIILYVLTDCVMYVGRDKIEGFGYQVAYSAKIGDAALIGAILIAATILQRGGFILPWWLMDGVLHITFGTICVLLGVIVCLLTYQARSGHLMDIYHDLVIAPFILYSAITLLPVIYLGGTIAEQMATIGGIALWLGLVINHPAASRRGMTGA